MLTITIAGQTPEGDLIIHVPITTCPVAGNTHDTQEARLTCKEEKSQDKLLSQHWMALINKLFEYCNITLEMHLPSLWLALAKLNKKQDLSIMQDEVTTNTGSPNHFSQMAPIISPQLAQDLISLTFAVPLTDNIKMGLQPFMVSDGTEEHHANNMEVACDYRFLAEGMVRICNEPLTTL